MWIPLHLIFFVRTLETVERETFAFFRNIVNINFLIHDVTSFGFSVGAVKSLFLNLEYIINTS